MSPRKFLSLAFLFLLVVPSCTTAPPELVEANKLSNQALKSALENRQIMVDAFTNELLAAYKKQLQLISDSALESAQISQEDGTEVVPRAVVDQVITARDAKFEEIKAQLQAKREEFLSNRSLGIAAELNEQVGDWLHTYVTEFAQRANELVRIGGELYGKAAGKEAPNLDFLSGGSK